MPDLAFNRYLSALRRKLGFLRGNFGLIIAWPLAALLLTATVWFVMLESHAKFRQQYEREAFHEASALARNYADLTKRKLEALDEIMLHLRYEYRLSAGTLQLDALRRDGLLRLSFLFDAAILDRNGRVVTATAASLRGTHMEEQPYFIAQKRTSDDRMYMGDTRPGEGIAAEVVYFSRGIFDSNGEFSGIVMVSVTADHFVASYDEMVFGPHGLLTLVGNDFSVRVSRVGNVVYPSGMQALVSAPVLPSPAGSMLLDGVEWFADARNRYLGWSQVAGYPLIAMAGLDQQTVMAPYRTNRAEAIRQALWGSLALAAFTIITMALSTRLAWRKYQMDLTQATYRTATEGSNEGFLMVRPLHALGGKLRDFITIDCNHRAAEMVGLRREDMVGKKLSSFFPQPYFDSVLHTLGQALEHGFYEGDKQPLPGSPVMASWLHIKAVRSGDDLAVTVRDISDSKAHVAELERRGNQDALTGLPNRHWVQTYLPGAVDRAAASKTMMAVLFIDLDGFKKINDSMGHSVGDELLRNAARRLNLAVRPQDHVVRLGGDEFVVILEHLERTADAAHVAERILHGFEEGFRLSKGVHSVGASIGISMFPADGRDAASLLQNADIAMYAVKTGGKRSYRFFESRFFDELRTRVDRETALRHAIEKDQFIMYYQPRIDIASGATCSLEALVRWQHPSGALVAPSEFIPLAEDTGLIVELGAMVIDKVCAQVALWEKRSKPLLPVSINVSPRQFGQGNLGQVVAAALERHMVAPSLIEIELTESSMIGESDLVRQSLLTMQHLGVKILVDDFGKGYSSLSQLQTLEFDVLKVDQAFTARIEASEQGKIFFRAIITMAHALGMRVVAEGVERSGQLAILKALDCDEAQGFYFSPPLPAELQQAAPNYA